jgi:hypothetical protein
MPMKLWESLGNMSEVFILFFLQCVCRTIFFLYCCAGWGYIMGIYKGCYKVLTILYLNFPFHLSSLSPLSPNSWKSFNRYHFCIYMHVCTFFCTTFTLLPPFPATSPVPLVPTHLPGNDLLHSPVLWFCRKDKR